MNPKLNVWRLETEKRQVDGHPVRVLVLRDQHGTVKRVAESYFEREEVKKWWRNYNRRIRIEDLPVSKRLRKKLTTIIEKLRREGFIYREISVGTTRNRKTGKREYKRIEVFKQTPWTRAEFFRIHEFFKKHIIKSNLGIFLVRDNKLYMHPITTRS